MPEPSVGRADEAEVPRPDPERHEVEVYQHEHGEDDDRDHHVQPACVGHEPGPASWARLAGGQRFEQQKQETAKAQYASYGVFVLRLQPDDGPCGHVTFETRSVSNELRAIAGRSDREIIATGLDTCHVEPRPLAELVGAPPCQLPRALANADLVQDARDGIV